MRKREKAIIAGLLIVTVVLVAIFVSPILFPGPPSWHYVGNFKSPVEPIDDKTTDWFNVQGSSFRLRWNYFPDKEFPGLSSFRVLVYRAETDKVVDTICRQGVNGTLTTCEHVESSSIVSGVVSDVNQLDLGPGAYYLRVVSANVRGWTIDIDDYRS